MKSKEQRGGILYSDVKVDSCTDPVSYVPWLSSASCSIPGNVPSLRNLLGVDVQRPTYCTVSAARLHLSCYQLT